MGRPIGAMKKGYDDRGMLTDMSGGEPGDWSVLGTQFTYKLYYAPAASSKASAPASCPATLPHRVDGTPTTDHHGISPLCA